MDFIDQYVQLRFRLWTNRVNLFIVYEQFPEEGEGVSKKLRQFNNQPECEEWLTTHKEAYKQWLKTFMVTSVTSPMGQPPSALTTTAALQRAKKKQSTASEDTLRTSSESPQKEPTSPETSAPESVPVDMQAKYVKTGDLVEGFGTVSSIKKNRVNLVFETSTGLTKTVSPYTHLKVIRSNLPF